MFYLRRNVASGLNIVDELAEFQLQLGEFILIRNLSFRGN